MKELNKDAMVPVPYEVVKVQQDTVDTSTLELKPAKGAKPMKFKPGQFNMIYVFGKGEVPISICGDPSSSGNLIHTVRGVGVVSKAIINSKIGAQLGVRGPFGSAWPVEEAEGKDVLVLAGGIGLPPLRPALYHILANRKKYRKFILLYGARTPQDIMYPKELEKWAKSGQMDVQVTVDRGNETWKGNVGVVTTLVPKVSFEPKKTIAMLVGPEIMMRFSLMALQEAGIPKSNVYYSMERNMHCGIGLCGHCQFGPMFICKDGPVFRADQAEFIFSKREV